MGIKDLLKNLEGATVQKNIGDFAGKRLAIDASGWLHKAVFATAEDWVDSNCTDSQLYVDFILTRVKNVQQCRVTPVMVFDGKRNNLKSETRAKRDEGRLSNIEHAKRLIDNIKQTSDAATRSKMRNECIGCFQRGLGVTHEMEKNCMAALRKAGIEIIVAPYEADPQLAYLCHIGYCDGVMTEDSDILVYSAVCGTPFPILYKFEKNGSVQITDLSLCGVFATSELKKESNMHKELSSTDLESLCNGGIGVADSTTSSTSSKKRKLDATRDPLAPVKMGSGADGFLNQLQMYFKPPARLADTSNGGNSSGVEAEGGENGNIVGRRMFVQLCLLAGCDYSDSIPGVGLMTAIQAVIRFKEVPNNLRLKKICDYFKLTGKRVADTYLPRLLRAEQLFYFHPVFNPYSDSIAHFTVPRVTEGSECDVNTASNGSNNGGGSAISSSNGAEGNAGPCITEIELFRLGADSAEILALSRPSPSGSPTTMTNASAIDTESTLTIRTACRGLSSLKDGTSIVPRYPWEGPDAPHQKGSSSGWYMRKSLIATLGGGSSASNSSSSTGFGSSTKAVSYFKSHTTTASMNYSHGSSGGIRKSTGTVNSFALANISPARPSGSSLFNMSKFALKSGPVEGYSKSNSTGKAGALPYQLQQQLSQRLTNPLPLPKATKNAYFDSIELTTATNNSLYVNTSSASSVEATDAAVKITSHHFQRSQVNRTTTYSSLTTETSQTIHTECAVTSSRNNATEDNELESFSAYSNATDEAMVYDLCEDSPPAKKQRRSPVLGDGAGQDNTAYNSTAYNGEGEGTINHISPSSSVMQSPAKVSVYDVLDSPAVSVAPTDKKEGSESISTSVNGGAMVLDLSSEGPVSHQLSFAEYLQSHKFTETSGTTAATVNHVERSGTCLVGSPSKLQMLLSPSSSTASSTTKTVVVEPNATTKKDRDHRTYYHLDGFDHDEQDILPGHPHQTNSFNENAQQPTRRKTLGAAPFVPILINNSSISTNVNTSSADKRKAYSAVPIARKKTTKSNSSSTGTMMVASIKSFFNAV